MPRKEKSRRDASSPRGLASPLPGLWPALAITALAAALSAQALRPTTSPTPASQIAEVPPPERTAALGTVGESANALATLAKETACPRPLALVTILHPPGQPDGLIRLRSGDYVSPAFPLTATPARVALPFPAPYASGHGVLSVLGATTAAEVALAPPWRVPADSRWRTRAVTWRPARDCR